MKWRSDSVDLLVGYEGHAGETPVSTDLLGLGVGAGSLHCQVGLYLNINRGVQLAKAMSLSKLFDQVGYEPHDVQREIHRARNLARFRVVCAGRRTGKSTLGGHELTSKAFSALYREDELSRHGRRSEWWIVGPEYTDAEKEFRVLYDDLNKLDVPFDRPGTYNDPISGNMHISLWDGKFQVHCKSAKYPGSLVGEALEGVILAEAAKLKPVIWTKYVRPMLSDYAHEGYGEALFTSTPEGKNWFYDLYQRGQDPADTAWYSTRMPSWSNNILFPAGRFDSEIVDMSKDMSEEKFKQEIGAEFTDFVGQVFKNFDEETHVTDIVYDPRWPLYIATDYGFTNPNVALFIQVDIWDNVSVIAEYYRRQRTAEEFAKDLQDSPVLGPLTRLATKLYPDPASPGDSKLLSEKLRLTIEGNTGGLISDRLDLIRRWLKPQPEDLEDGHPDKKPKLMIDRSCSMLISEMGDYRYPETKRESSIVRENPLPVDDHAPEALGRFFASRYAKQINGKKTGARQSKASILTGR